MASEYEERYDRYREESADWTTDELMDQRDKLRDAKPHLTTKQAAKLDAILDELDDRHQDEQDARRK